MQIVVAIIPRMEYNIYEILKGTIIYEEKS